MLSILGSFVLIGLLSNVFPHPTGPLHTACLDLMPRHGIDVQPLASSPFSIEVGKTQLNSGDTIDVTIRSSTTTDKIKGIMMQARSGGSAIGKWNVDDTNIYARKMNCFGIDDTLGPRSIEGEGPSSVTFTWQAPIYEHLENYVVKFNATVAVSFEKFWVGIVSVPVYLN